MTRKFKNFPTMKVEYQTGFLRKETVTENVVPFTIGVCEETGGTDLTLHYGGEVQALFLKELTGVGDLKNVVTDLFNVDRRPKKITVPLSLHQVMRAIHDFQKSCDWKSDEHVMDFTPEGVAAMAEKYGGLKDSKLDTNHIRSMMGKRPVLKVVKD